MRVLRRYVSTCSSRRFAVAMHVVLGSFWSHSLAILDALSVRQPCDRSAVNTAFQCPKTSLFLPTIYICAHPGMRLSWTSPSTCANPSTWNSSRSSSRAIARRRRMRRGRGDSLYTVVYPPALAAIERAAVRRRIDKHVQSCHNRRQKKRLKRTMFCRHTARA